jgi:NitT/TauT family transport system substrate-binding protein
VLALFASACGDNGGTTSAATTTAPTATAGTPTVVTTAPRPVRDVTIMLPGLPGAAAGGFFAASAPAIQSKYALNIKLTQAGQGVFNTIPQVASGAAQFSLSSTSNILTGRAQKIPVVEIFAGYNYPTCFMSHPESNIKTFADLNGKTVAVTPGSAYWLYIKAKYKLDAVKEVAYTGGIGPWVADKNLVQQCVSLNEPYLADQQKIPHQELLVSDSGFNPYQNILFTTEDTIKNQTQLVKDLVGAVAEGWKVYLADPTATNQAMIKAGSDQSEDQMKFVVAALKGGLMPAKIGFTDPARVETLYNQLREVSVLTADLDFKASYTNDYVP